jgi:putative DNA primase/helicase
MEEMERDVDIEIESEVESDIVINYPSWIIVSAKGKLTVNEVEFCKMFLQNRDLKCIGGQFRDIQGEVGEDEIKYEISKIITEHIVEGVSGKVKSVTETLKLRCYSEPPTVCEDEIHLLNGILKTDGKFVPEQRFCTNRLNVEYDSSAPPLKKFMSFLADLLEPDDIVTLQEYLGYLLIPSTKGQAMLSIIGNGGEGKSVLGTVIKDIFGESMTEGSFRRIETDRFFRANLKGKLVFVDDDLQLEALPTTGYIKSLITIQIPTDIEYKGKQSYCEKLYARFLCFGNGTIKSLRDKSHGFSRRMIILSAKPVAPNRITNPNIAEEIISEKAGILNWLFEGLKRLIANNYQFTLSEKARLNAAEMSSDNCNIIEFLSSPNTVIFSDTAEISSAVLYGVYLKWCDENALTATKRDVFTGWLKTNQQKYKIQYSSHIATANGGCVRGFKGIQTK